MKVAKNGVKKILPKKQHEFLFLFLPDKENINVLYDLSKFIRKLLIYTFNRHFISRRVLFEQVLLVQN